MILSKSDQEFLAVCHHIVSGVMNMVHPLLPEEIQVVFLGVAMEGGKAVRLYGVIKIVTRNQTGRQVIYLDQSMLILILRVLNCSCEDGPV